MTDARTDPAAWLRGTSVGVLTAALAVAAHGAAGGGWPAGAVIAQLALLAVTLGAVASTMRAANRTGVLVGLLGTGQVLGHALLAIDGHTHGSHPLQPGALMLAAHLVAVTVGAILIAGGTRLSSALSRVLRAVARRVPPIPAATTHVVARSADQPLQSARLLATSVSHRGPPVSVLR
ncbi:hypothetical protein A5784_29425 [Mycobacterium sp. 852013-50091_SCH5140682]|uniref:hypothetical protein n=1 Tax=Mycobacterium sp. 852013-50091_SCH5140682 TaxID=1834109 RepID=UPI0007EC1F9E|nr:hypothetical protein [Mycobacterium sp. 852013-50091_SCH5140682]OBC14735.1 hypothetical protein A5784_29425 [Mycobacterium sp. 852013-50091_SCH5140682]